MCDLSSPRAEKREGARGRPLVELLIGSGYFVNCSQAEWALPLLSVTVRNGQPVGGVLRVEIDMGAQVLLIVRSDVEDEAHLHGYDLAAKVAPGHPARIRFRANEVGSFELELEESAVPLAELEVHP